jgi:hypothetical protein
MNSILLRKRTIQYQYKPQHPSSPVVARPMVVMAVNSVQHCATMLYDVEPLALVCGVAGFEM